MCSCSCFCFCFSRQNKEEKEEVYVFVSRQAALKAMGKMPGARFKTFSTRQEAETFSKGMNTPKSGMVLHVISG